MADFRFTRQERLKSRKLIGQLFKEGQAFVAYPLRVAWALLPPAADPAIDAPAQLAISVPKRSFKTAVARNRLKRRIREAYRLHKPEWYAKLGGQRVALMLMYIAKEELSFAEIEAGMVKMLKKWPVGK